MNRIRYGAAACAAALLAACAGNGGTALPEIHAATTAQLTIKWPTSQALRHLRRPLYISPSAMSVVVEVNNDPAKTTIANNTTGGQGGTQTVQFNAPPGSDTFAISLWDQQNGQGSELGQVTFSQAIVAAQTNTISATVEGVLAKVSVTKIGTEPFFLSRTDEGGAPFFSLTSSRTGTVAVAPLDADGNVILGEGGVQSVSLTSSSSIVSVTPVAAIAGEYTVTRTAPATANTHATLVATGTDGNGFTATTRYPLHLSPAMYTAYENGGTGSIAVTDDTGAAIATAGHFSGVSDPKGIAYDTDDDVLFVADAGSNKVLAFDRDGNAASGVAQMSVPGASALTYDAAAKQLYVTSSTQNTVSVFTPRGTPVVSSGFSGLQSPNGIATILDASNNGQLTVTSAVAGQMPQLFNSDGSPASSLSQDPALASSSVAYDADQDVLWIGSTGSGAAQLTAYSVYGFSDYAYTSGLTQPTAVAYDAFDGDVYAADASGTISGFTDQYPFSQDPTVSIHAPGLTAPSAIAFVY